MIQEWFKYISCRKSADQSSLELYIEPIILHITLAWIMVQDDYVNTNQITYSHAKTVNCNEK